MKQFSKIALYTVILLIPVISSCKKEQAQGIPENAEFIAGSSAFSGFKQWNLVATNNGVNTSMDAAHGGNQPESIRKIYLKDGIQRENGTFPLGTMVVKESTNPTTGFIEITAMVKRGNKFNPGYGDWEYFMVNADGTIMQDGSGMIMRGGDLMNGMCRSCHSNVEEKDFIFSY